jgi:hypothetical protein
VEATNIRIPSYAYRWPLAAASSFSLSEPSSRPSAAREAPHAPRPPLFLHPRHSGQTPPPQSHTTLGATGPGEGRAKTPPRSIPPEDYNKGLSSSTRATIAPQRKAFAQAANHCAAPLPTN